MNDMSSFTIWELQQLIMEGSHAAAHELLDRIELEFGGDEEAGETYLSFMRDLDHLRGLKIYREEDWS